MRTLLAHANYLPSSVAAKTLPIWSAP